MDNMYCPLCGSPTRKLLVNPKKVASNSDLFRCLDRKKKGCGAIIAYTEKETILITRYTNKDFPEQEGPKKPKKKKPPSA